jgi:hypothetical protein
MATHLSMELIRRFEGRKASRAEIDEVCDHLWTCDICHQAYLTVLERRFPLEIDLDDLAGLKGWHLQGKELAAYLAGEMNELDFRYAAIHLQQCSKCRYEASQASTASVADSGRRKRRLMDRRGILPRVLPTIHSAASARFQVSVIALVMLASLIILLAISRPRHVGNLDASRLPGQDEVSLNLPKPERPPTPTPSPLPEDIPGADPARKSIRNTGGAASQLTDRAARAQAELALVRADLIMPPAIHIFDASEAELIRGNASSNESFSIIAPFNTIVAEDRPTFRWTPLSGTTSYAVCIYDANLHEVTASGPLSSTKWVSPRLLRDITYTWIVTALKEGREMVAPAPPARAEFRIAKQTDLEKLNQGINATVSHTARGVLYARAGLLDEAEHEFDTDLKAKPMDKQARNLLKKVKSWRSGSGASYGPPSPTTTKPAQ